MTSLTSHTKIIESGLRLLIKYVSKKFIINGSISNHEIRFLRHVMAFSPITFNSVIHSFNQKDIDINNLKLNSFLKTLSQFYDIKHELWGESGLCPKALVNPVNKLTGCDGYLVKLDKNEANLYTKTYSTYRKLAILNVPWKYNQYQYNPVSNAYVFRPVLIKTTINGQSRVKGLYMRINKQKAIKFLSEKGLYGIKTNINDWHPNIDFKYTLKNISIDLFSSEQIQIIKDMKNILTPIDLSINDPVPTIQIPKIISNVTLKLYQTANVEWMYHIEKNIKNNSVIVDTTKEIIPKIHYDQVTDIVHETKQPSTILHSKGGGLFDEVGLGKTLTIITLVVTHPPDSTIGCQTYTNNVIKPNIPTCQARIKTGKRVKENKGLPVICGRVIKIAKVTKSKNTEKTQKNINHTLEFLMKHKVCNMHSKSLSPASALTPTMTSTPASTMTSPPASTLTPTPASALTPTLLSDSVFVKKKSNKWMSRATLIICPNQIPYQWLNQIKQYTNPMLNTITITNIHEARKITYIDIINADIVITTIDCIERGTVNRQTELEKIKLDDNCPSFDLIWWHRIAFDEMHRITNKKYRKAIFYIFSFPSTYRWSVTGTPFNKNQLNYDVMVSWIFGDKEFNAQAHKRSFSKLQACSKLLTGIFRRNTKKSTEHLRVTDSEKHEKLWQTVTQTEIWLNLSIIERSMYNARKATKPYWMKDKDDEYLRQICCHPNLNSENSKIVHAVNHCNNKSQRYKTDSNEVKKALINNNINLIEKLIEKDIPSKINSSWNAQTVYLLDKNNKKTRMAYFCSVHQIKRALFKLYQLRKSMRAYTDVYKRDSSPIVIKVCDGYCFSDIKIITEGTTIHVGECGHIFCNACATHKFPTPFSMNLIDDKIPKTYAKKIIEGYTRCRACTLITSEDVEIQFCDFCGNESTMRKCKNCNKNAIKTIGIVDAIKIEPVDLMIDMYSSNEGSESESAKNNASNEHYIPESFREEMDYTISLYGTKIAHLVAYLKTFTANPYNQRIIIFSQWDNLLQGIMQTLINFDLPVITCKGNVFQKKKAIHNFKTNSYYKIFLLSSKYAASGLDLVEANKIIFIDPTYGDFDKVTEVEEQMLGRIHRLGQKNPIEVARFLVKNTIEEECFNEWKIINNKVN